MFLRTLLTSLILSWSFSVSALMVSDVDIADKVSVAKPQTELTLNGAAMRKKFLLVDVYIGGLYLEKPSHSPADIISSDSYKRMMFHVLLKRVSARKVANALNEALVINLTKEEHQILKPEIDQFLACFTDIKLHKGDQVTIDYIPGKGTLVHIPGAEDKIIKGKDFYDALLQVWIGPQPVSNEFKRQILGISDDDNLEADS